MVKNLSCRAGVAFIVALFLAWPADLLAGRARTSGGSVRQSRTVSTDARANSNVNRNTNVNQNVNVNRNVNVNQNVNVNRNVNTGGAYGRGGVAVVGEEGAAAVGRRGAVVAGEEGVAAVGRYGGGVVYGEHYESYEGWKVAAGVMGGIAIGTMLARPPTTSTTVVVAGSPYYYSDGAYYQQVAYAGDVSYQVVAAPTGAIITTLPAGCTVTQVGNVSYQLCGQTYYQRVSNGYQVVVLN